ncbi:radical SAM protein [Streptomyces syringium]|uniref:Radical SAM superfamily enzyme with C-terminal helix-hairpin-helix motif n=1 Tax=Streptomyces syringium TaxID=76729 RepID=A0ABS4XW36_9ACTN|nr:radical SAM protein [Streptomyces syringium]MBP2400733.1 radical SAM superfamily enzyme with C-terminal helix-hairpin-helix motif [Streptomyces syringium]
MSKPVVILDCYTVEPSGLGVPPYLSTYVRQAWSALGRAWPGADVHYLTVDDVRWNLAGGQPAVQPPLSDRLTYSATVNRYRALALLHDAAAVVVVAGDKVPSVHLHAVNAGLEEIARAVACVRGNRCLLGPMATYAAAEPAQWAGLFDALHTHTLTSANIATGSLAPAAYGQLREDRTSFTGLVEQMKWRPIAELELYRGCTRRTFCTFCNEPAKSPLVTFRDVGDVIEEAGQLYDAGVRNFRLGQQTCFFSYRNRDEEAIRALLAGIRERCPELEVLHIDNADPLAVAAPVGLRIAKLVAEYGTEGNCAPMGIESFDPAVIERNTLTCTPEILYRAISHVNDAGADRGPGGLPRLLPGLNLIYGLPGETHATHIANLRGLAHILDTGLLCHRTNVRKARAFPGTPLATQTPQTALPSAEHFTSWKADIDHGWDQPMKERVYPAGLKIPGLHSYFVDQGGTWWRRLGSYSIQIVEREAAVPVGTPGALTVTGHAPRMVYGQRHTDAP